MIPKPEEQYAAMTALYREWNERINVVSRKDIDCLYAHHILHSLAIAEYVERFYPGAFAGAEVLRLLDKFHPRMNDSAIQFYYEDYSDKGAIFSISK